MAQRRWLVPAVLTLAFAAPPSAVQGANKDPAGTGAIMGQLRALFAQWDRNNDGYLDKNELARAFGYSRPYDAGSRPGSDKDKPAAAGKDADPEKKKAAYPDRLDYQFLVQLDQDGDGKVSRDEFVSWARDYAATLKKLAQTQEQVARAEARLAYRSAAATQRKWQSELKAHQQALATLTKQMASFETHIQKILMKRSGH